MLTWRLAAIPGVSRGTGTVEGAAYHATYPAKQTRVGETWRGWKRHWDI